MKLAEGYTMKAVDGEYILFPTGRNVADGKGIVSLNKNGSYVLNRILEGAEPEQIAQELIAEYHAETEYDIEYIKNDVNCYLERMTFHGILVE